MMMDLEEDSEWSICDEPEEGDPERYSDHMVFYRYVFSENILRLDYKTRR